MEAHEYPIWASQFHPEKNPYEWTRHYNNIPHSKEAMDVSAFFARYFGLFRLQSIQLFFQTPITQVFQIFLQKNSKYSFFPKNK